MKKTLKSDSGVVLLVCLAILFMLSLIGIASITTSNTDMRIADNEYKMTGAFYAAESGLEKAAVEIWQSYSSSGAPPSPLPSDTMSELNYTYGYSTVDGGPAVPGVLTGGAYQGLVGYLKTFTISSIGTDNTSVAGVELNMTVQDASIPIFQFAVFYQNDLEMSPLADLLLGGRVHTNGNMYLQAGDDLYINSFLTASGSIFHGPKEGSGLPTSMRDVWIKDATDIYMSMQNHDHTFLDALSESWVTESLNRWGGRVEDGNHGITELYMPVVSSGGPTNLIDRGDGNPDSYEHDAGLKIIDGQALYKAGDIWINITGILTASGAMTTGHFYDAREGKDAYTVDLDISRLNVSGYFPSNGIIYASTAYSPSQVNGLRLVNGSQLANALTVATDNPLYTVGDFNTMDQRPAALISDAFTVLSNGWNDERSWGSPPDRQATQTRINASYITGNTETGADGYGYNGGFENLPRFLEQWTGVNFVWRGSAANLWYSRQNIAGWSTDYFSPPNLDWAFDISLLDPAKLPPGTPMANVVQRTRWSQKIHPAPRL